MIELEFIGAAGTVTGSRHLLTTSKAAVLLDCGLFQGHRNESKEKNRNFKSRSFDLDAIVLSHAHIDHSGALPCIYLNGFRGPVYSTPATRDLCLPMLMDAAWIQQSDARFIQKLISKGVKNLDPVEPLYTQSEVIGIISQFIGLPYHRSQTIAPGVNLTFYDAGHVLGSAVSVLDISDDDEKIRLIYTGDLGRKHLPILRDPEIPPGGDYLLMESTYGNRLHDDFENSKVEFGKMIRRTVERGGKVIIPTFALERAQEIIYALNELYLNNEIPSVPIYMDSPLSIKITEVFKLHPECFDSETLNLLNSERSPFDLKNLVYINTVEESKSISKSQSPCIIISASGMCEGGRILHHLMTTVEDEKNSIAIVGYQAENTLGRRILEKQPKLKIFGSFFELKSEVYVLNGFSAHADQNGLSSFARSIENNGNLKEIILIHGEPNSQNAFKSYLKNQSQVKVSIPRSGDCLQLN